MEYREIKFDIDYDRRKQRWNAWGSLDHDLFLVNKIPEILGLLSEELKPAKGNLPETPSVDLEDLRLSKSRLQPADEQSLRKICVLKTDRFERVLHSVGQSYYDLIRLRTNRLKHFVDGVLYPKNTRQIQRLMAWAGKNSIALIPFGGGSSVVGGLEPLKGKGQRAVLSLDLSLLSGLICLDTESRLATFWAGTYGPQIEKELNQKGWTLGHFPQSFEYSTIGGWVAARSAGQQSNRYGKIEELLCALEVITPSGNIQTLEVPAAATGPSINQVLAGSEGLLGVITRVTVKIHELPERRHYFGVLFDDFESSVAFQRDLVASSLELSMIRISDADETRLLGMLSSLGKEGFLFRAKRKLEDFVLRFHGIGEKRCLVMIGMDSDANTVERQDILIRSYIQRHGGFYVGSSLGRRWMKGRFNMPFLRNYVMEHGVGIDTLESATIWKHVPQLHEGVLAALQKAVPNCIAMCHLSHSYHDGACLYFTVIFLQDRKDPIAQWRRLKKAASDALIKYGGNMSHHHGIGQDHKAHYQRQLSKQALSMLRSVKRELDPEGILNPGKLFD